MKFLCLTTALVVAACGSKTRQIRLELLNRASCGTSTAQYDTTCIKAVKIQMVGADGRRFRSQCSQLHADHANLQELFSSTTVQTVLDEVRAREAVYLEFRAYHALEGGDPCEAVADANLMLWGTSETIDTTDLAVTEVILPLECRPDCDCAELDTPRCPLDLVQGVCAPPRGKWCRKICSVKHDGTNTCYDPTMDCTQGTCTPPVTNDPETAKCCTPSERRMCAYCDDNADCLSNRCVIGRHVGLSPPAEERFCAEPCPPLPDVSLCPTGMSCHRLGDGIYEPG